VGFRVRIRIWWCRWKFCQALSAWDVAGKPVHVIFMIQIQGRIYYKCNFSTPSSPAMKCLSPTIHE
jgi:hypothetical protein